MATVIEAKAVISAEDKTGNAFDAIARKLRGLGRDAKLSAEIDKTTKALGQAEKQLKTIAQLGSAEKAFDKARDRLAKVTTAQDLASKAAAASATPNRRLQDTVERTTRAVADATQAFERQRVAVIGAREAVTKSGVPLARIEGEQRRLRATVTATNASLERQVALQVGGGTVVRGLRRAPRADGGGGLAVPPIGVLAPAALAYGGARAVANYAGAERQLTRIGITADASREEMRDVMREAQGLARANALPYDKVVSGYDALAAQGRSMKSIRAFMPSIATTAQASGAEVEEIAKTADTVETNFKVKDMQQAFDIMVGGGKAGQFELKDMARYLPSLAPSASAIGFEGTKGLSDLVSMLQVMRKGSGTSEEAVASMNNILAKMESDKTVKGLKEKGIDAKKEFEKARKEGTNLVAVFEDMVNRALKGDRSKLGDLIDDMEFKRGVQALMTYRNEWQKMSAEIQATSAGSAARDRDRVLGDSQTRIDQLTGSWDRFKKSLGESVAIPAVPALNSISEGLEKLLDQYDRVRKDPAKASAATVEKVNAAIGKPDDWGLGGLGRALSGDPDDQRTSALAGKRGQLEARRDFELSRLRNEEKAIAKRRTDAEAAVADAQSRREAARAGIGTKGAIPSDIDRANTRRITEAEAKRDGILAVDAGRLEGARGKVAAIEEEIRLLDQAAGRVEELQRRLAALDATKALRPTLGIDTPGEARVPIFNKDKGMNFGFGPGGTPLMGGEAWEYGARVPGAPLPPSRPPSATPPSLDEALGKITAKVVDPVPVKVEGTVLPMMITIKVDGNGEVVGGSSRTVPVTIRGGSTGTSMPGAQPQGFAPTMSGV